LRLVTALAAELEALNVARHIIHGTIASPLLSFHFYERLSFVFSFLARLSSPPAVILEGKAALWRLRTSV
jgi:hypothetical protein